MVPVFSPSFNGVSLFLVSPLSFVFRFLVFSSRLIENCGTFKELIQPKFRGQNRPTRALVYRVQPLTHSDIVHQAHGPADLNGQLT